MSDVLEQVQIPSRESVLKPNRSVFKIIAVAVIAALVVLGLVWLFKSISKASYEVISKTGSREIVVYLPKNDANIKNVNKIIENVKKDTEDLQAKNSSKDNIYILRVYDDKTIAQEAVNPASRPANTNQDEIKKLLATRQKTQFEHLVFMSNSATKWQVIYGSNYQSLKGDKSKLPSFTPNTNNGAQVQSNKTTAPAPASSVTQSVPVLSPSTSPIK